MISTEALREILKAGLDPAALVRVRRPNALYQVNLPAFLEDGDAVQVYVRPGRDDRVILTDLGSTLMRMSYGGPVKDSVLNGVAELAEANGLVVKGGELVIEVGRADILPAMLGLLQVETQAEALAAEIRHRDKSVSEFRQMVIDFVVGVFGADKVRQSYHDATRDPEGVSTVDAIVQARRPLAVAAVPNELAAERAIGTKYMIGASLDPKTRWIAVPRDLNKLSRRTQTRLLRAYIPAAPSFMTDREVVKARLLDQADLDAA